MKQVLLQPGYVLHQRLYRESSLLVELWTRDHGRLTVIAKGVRKPRSAQQGLLQPFIPLLLSFSGKTELLTLTHVEMQVEVRVNSLQGECLFAGFYLNELLMTLLPKWDAHPILFAAYEKAVLALHGTILEQKALRSFEQRLLDELGYGVLPKSQHALQQTFHPNHYYRFTPEQGFVTCEPSESPQIKSNIFSGEHLLAIACEDWQNESILLDAKRLTRIILTSLLGMRPLYSRQLFILP